MKKRQVGFRQLRISFVRVRQCQVCHTSSAAQVRSLRLAPTSQWVLVCSKLIWYHHLGNCPL